MSVITDPYVLSKQKRPYQDGLITQQAVRAEEKKLRQQKLYPPVPRPSSGTRCDCGRLLYHYEERLGKCVPCAKASISQTRIGA